MLVRKEIGPVFQPDVFQFADAFPKTRSGKTMRRILKNIAAGTDIGNVTTLEDPSVVDTLLEEPKKIDVETGLNLIKFNNHCFYFFDLEFFKKIYL